MLDLDRGRHAASLRVLLSNLNARLFAIRQRARRAASRCPLQRLRLVVVAKVSAQSIAEPLPLPDLYAALQHGTVDGAVVAWTAFQPYKLAEVTGYH